MMIGNVEEHATNVSQTKAIEGLMYRGISVEAVLHCDARQSSTTMHNIYKRNSSLSQYPLGLLKR